MKRMQMRLAVAGVVLWGVGVASGVVWAQTTTGEVRWSGGAGSGNPGWNEPSNWVGGEAPANPTPGRIFFHTNGVEVAGMLDADRQVGRFSAGFSSQANSGPAATHTLQMDSRTLVVAGDFDNFLQGSFTLTNGTLQIGADGVPGNFLSGGTFGATTPAVTRLSPGMTFNTYNVDTFRMGGLIVNPTTGVFSDNYHINNQNAQLDLRGVTISGGELRAGNIVMHAHYHASAGTYIAVDATTINLGAIVVTNALHIGVEPGLGGRTFIGDPSDAARRLPAGVDVLVGLSPSQRGSLTVGDLGTGSQTANITLSASSGGKIEAYVTDLRVMRHTGWGTAVLNGTLDLSAMTNCLIDAVNIEIGSAGNADARSRGIMRLPAGIVTAGNVAIGDDLGNDGFGLLEMSNTVFTVTNAVALHRTGIVTNHIGTAASGFDITRDDPGAWNMHADARLTVRFSAPPDSLPHYGFRWAGDHVATLNTMIQAGQVLVDDAGMMGPSAVVFSNQGATYIGVPPPSGTVIMIR